jgi:hypothetical protein
LQEIKGLAEKAENLTRVDNTKKAFLIEGSDLGFLLKY